MGRFGNIRWQEKKPQLDNEYYLANLRRWFNLTKAVRQLHVRNTFPSANTSSNYRESFQLLQWIMFPDIQRRKAEQTIQIFDGRLKFFSGDSTIRLDEKGNYLSDLSMI